MANPQAAPIHLASGRDLISRLRLAIERDVWPADDWDTIDAGEHRRAVALGPRRDGRTTCLLILVEIEKRLGTPFD